MKMYCDDIKPILTGYIKLYLTGLYSVSWCMKQIDDTIQSKTEHITDIDSRIKQQNALYRFILDKLHKAIVKMDKH